VTKAEIKEAALARFASQGYQATTLRELAEDLGVTPAAFYYHYQTKDELLSDLLEDILRDDLAMFRAIRRGPDSPLELMLYAHIPGDEIQQMQQRVVQYETHSLQNPSRQQIRRLIHEYESEFAEEIAKEYGLSGQDLEFATKAVLGMGLSVGDWFQLDGSVSADQMRELYTSYMRGILESAAKRSLADTDGRLAEDLDRVLGEKLVSPSPSS
jgi:AcrR family transcriptional regulator